jgi:hypothetical protein
MSNTDEATLVRGAFHDDLRDYKVRVSSVHAPDWGPFWRSFKPAWKIWVEESAMRVFNRGRHDIESAPAARWCNG